jgi:hypothetical protein
MSKEKKPLPDFGLSSKKTGVSIELNAGMVDKNQEKVTVIGRKSSIPACSRKGALTSFVNTNET